MDTHYEGSISKKHPKNTPKTFFTILITSIHSNEYFLNCIFSYDLCMDRFILDKNELRRS